MTVVRRSSFSSLLLLCFPLLATLCQTCGAAGSAMIEAISCSASGNYTPSDAYATNLNQFLSELPENAVSKNGGFFNGTVGSGTDTVYGLALCSAGYSRADCGSCLADTSGSNTGGLPTRCPGSTTVFTVFDKCLVRYSNTNFLGTAETETIYSSSAGELAGALRLNYSGEVYNQLQLLTGEAVNSPQRFAASATGPPYVLTQCTWDLPPDKCKQCLDLLSKNATTSWLNMMSQGESKSYSCTVRYSNTSFTVVPFQDVSSAGPLPPNPSPVDRTSTSAPPSPPAPSTSKSSRTIAAATGSVSAVSVVVLLGFCVWRARSRSQHNTHVEDGPAGQIQETTAPATVDANMGQTQATTIPSTSSEAIGQGQPITIPATSREAIGQGQPITIPATSTEAIGQGPPITIPSSAARVNANNQGNELKGYVPRPYTYEELADATSNFARRKKLGNGAYGIVYEGRLPGIDMTVAIKEMKITWTAQAQKGFHNEIEIMRKLHHRNVLGLVGWCDQGEHLLLVYEIMHNGNLEERLYPGRDLTVYGATHSASLLSWPARFKILVGIASGLQYLHQDCQEAILHRDIKPANIMLDREFNAKLADFGLVTQMSHTTTSHHTDDPIGTLPYIDPAYVDSGKARGQCDVYSLGVMLLEIACGVKPTILQPGGKNSLIEMVRKCKAGSGDILKAADKSLTGPFDEQIRGVLELGLSCVTDPAGRPHAGRVRSRLAALVERTDSVSTSGAEASTSHTLPEQFSTCPSTFAPTQSQGDEEVSLLREQR